MLAGGGHFVIWNKLFASSLILENKIRFPEGVVDYEDVIFSFIVYALAKKCFWLSPYLYHYERTRSTALTFPRAKASDQNLLERLAKINEKIKEGVELVEDVRDVRQDKELSDYLFRVKLNAKSKYLFGLSRPDFRQFRSTFPEANSSLSCLQWIFKNKAPGLAIPLLAIMHMDVPARALIWMRKRLKG